MINIYQKIDILLDYGETHQLIETEDRIYSKNKLLALFDLEHWHDVQKKSDPESEIYEIMDQILDWAFENGKIKENTGTQRDILDSMIIDCLMPRPSELTRLFDSHFEKSPEAATDFFYSLSKASNYIHMDRIAKNRDWEVATEYGNLNITINLSKPEKDPKEIALLKELPTGNYPTCLLCKDNVGYKGTLRHPARTNHRIIPIKLNREAWNLQYSPYVYYHEHCIIFRDEHLPMKISEATFRRLLDFVDIFPHYFVGSNADLPIVGGSILSHDHFQGGKFTFAIEKADINHVFKLAQFPNVKFGIVDWPMSVIRITGSKIEVEQATSYIWEQWQGYSDPSVEIYAYVKDIIHNTVTPIARRRGASYEMDVVLRNNRTSEKYPSGIFHPHKELHHIKQENIGLIEVMGLAVLPGRLLEELSLLAEYLVYNTERESWNEAILKHFQWYQDLKGKYHFTKENVNVTLQQEVGLKFKKVLEHAGVFKTDANGKLAFIKFVNTL
ncbi:UDP-glucose--hexose-1-phosphate uridylyltransferase [Bacillaceae bacterium IKA-2]|nr:UDP-glucose--hexose-1-phosphate uridylyltransferase [Bacillaceae bacterium IKA-2]